MPRPRQALLTAVMAWPAAIAIVHAEALRAEDTDWPQILILYRMLERLAPGPVVALSRIVAVAMVDGPRTALCMLASLDTEIRMAGHYLLVAGRRPLFTIFPYPALVRSPLLPRR